MKLKSLIRYKNRLLEAEVEIKLMPGIPQIHFTGLVDRQIKESFFRIKSALKSCGYHFPVTQQVIVNIKPNHVQKTSCGIELAVALGILIQTKQIPNDLISKEWIIYGELGLEGEVFEPNDTVEYKGATQILSGKSQNSRIDLHRLSNLKNLEIEYQNKADVKRDYKRPEFGLNKKYSSSEAEFLFLMSVGGFHALLAGDAGAGKSTLARCLPSFLSEPNPQDISSISEWRPLIAPHQTITQAAFIGGGAQLHEGEIERVNGGILLLDELLEFRPEVIETLRGPMVGEPLRLARSASEREIESNFQVVATTNLCPCGMWTPLKINLGCRFSRTRCRRYLEKLSGPIVDRFGIIYFMHGKDQRTIKGKEIVNRIEKFMFYKKESNTLNKIEDLHEENLDAEKLDEKEGRSITDELRKILYTELSERRWCFLKKVALLKAIDEQKPLSIEHFKYAEKWTITPFLQLAKGMD